MSDPFLFVAIAMQWQAFQLKQYFYADGIFNDTLSFKNGFICVFFSTKSSFIKNKLCDGTELAYLFEIVLLTIRTIIELTVCKHMQ